MKLSQKIEFVKPQVRLSDGSTGAIIAENQTEKAHDLLVQVLCDAEGKPLQDSEVRKLSGRDVTATGELLRITVWVPR